MNKNLFLKILKYLFLISIFFFIILPLISVLFSSIFNTTYIHPEKSLFFTLKWYVKLFNDQRFLIGLVNSISVGVISSILGTIMSLYLGLNWRENNKRMFILIIIIFLAVIPPDIHALGIKYIFRYVFGYKKSTLIALVFSHISAILPYCWLLIVAVLSQVSNQIINISYDLGGTKVYTIRKVILPLIKPAIFSSLALGFLISFNEYGRVYYLSGPTSMISEIIFGKMVSGTDPSVNALGGFSIIIVIIFIILIVFSYLVVKRKLDY